MPGMTDLQAILVADRRDAIFRDGAALRAERERDHRRDHLAGRTNAVDRRADPAPTRVRLGRWLVAVGEAVAGGQASSRRASRAIPAEIASAEGSNDGEDRLPKAA